MKTKNAHLLSVTKLRAGLLIATGVVLTLNGFLPNLRHVALADSYQDQINSLAAENARSQAAVASLRGQAVSYQGVISQLQSQISSLQVSINANQAQQASLEQQITDDQNQITLEKGFLASSVKSMYVDGTPSTLEILATSKNLSDFIDKQEYRGAIQNKLQDMLTKIAALQVKLQSQKQQVDALLSQLHAQQSQLDSDRSQQEALLSYNQSQQSTYLAQVRSNNNQIAEVQAERAAAIAKISGAGGQSAVGSPVKYKNFTTSYSLCGGGYSYCWAGYDQIVSDPWGLGYAHECVHYVADWLSRHGYTVPHFAGGDGNANDWAKYGTVVSTPRVGDVAYMPIAPVGHVGIVTALNSDGTVHVSQMNWPVGGYYSEMDLYITSGIQFIRFPS